MDGNGRSPRASPVRRRSRSACLTAKPCAQGNESCPSLLKVSRPPFLREQPRHKTPAPTGVPAYEAHAQVTPPSEVCLGTRSQPIPSHPGAFPGSIHSREVDDAPDQTSPLLYRATRRERGCPRSPRSHQGAAGLLQAQRNASLPPADPQLHILVRSLDGWGSPWGAEPGVCAGCRSAAASSGNEPWHSLQVLELDPRLSPSICHGAWHRRLLSFS